MMSSPVMASYAPFGTDPQAVALENVQANPRPRVSRRGRNPQDGSVLTAYPLPNFDSPTMANMPAGSIPGQPTMVFQQPIIATEPVSVPQMSNTTYSTSPMVAGVPPLIPQADPAHSMEASPEMTASTPIVDPH